MAKRRSRAIRVGRYDRTLQRCKGRARKIPPGLELLGEVPSRAAAASIPQALKGPASVDLAAQPERSGPATSVPPAAARFVITPEVQRDTERLVGATKI